MKNTIKKIVVLLFLTMFSLSVFGMLDTGRDRKIMLSEDYNIKVRESVIKFIETHDISIQDVVDLYNASIDDPSTCRFDGKAIFICDNQLIEMSISKKDHSIIRVGLIDEELIYEG